MITGVLPSSIWRLPFKHTTKYGSGQCHQTSIVVLLSDAGNNPRKLVVVARQDTLPKAVLDYRERLSYLFRQLGPVLDESVDMSARRCPHQLSRPCTHEYPRGRDPHLLCQVREHMSTWVLLPPDDLAHKTA